MSHGLFNVPLSSVQVVGVLETNMAETL